MHKKCERVVPCHQSKLSKPPGVNQRAPPFKITSALQAPRAACHYVREVHVHGQPPQPQRCPDPTTVPTGASPAPGTQTGGGGQPQHWRGPHWVLGSGANATAGRRSSSPACPVSPKPCHVSWTHGPRSTSCVASQREKEPRYRSHTPKWLEHHILSDGVWGKGASCANIGWVVSGTHITGW